MSVNQVLTTDITNIRMAASFVSLVTLTLKMTSEMRDDIDKALILTQDTVVCSRSEFIRAACQYAIDSIARSSGDVPVSVAERKERVLAGSDGLEV